MSGLFGGGKPDTSATDKALAETRKQNEAKQKTIDAAKASRGRRGRRQLLSGSELGIVTELKSELGG